MATIKKRINISVPKDIERALAKLAERDSMPQATKAAHLLAQAIEAEEDMVWDAIARKRMQTPRFVSHERAWGIR
jgi:predicted DNA-binding protein